MMSDYRANYVCKQTLAITQSQIPLFFTFGIISLVSPALMVMARALLIISTVKSYRLLSTSNMTVSADRKPAIGALTLSFLLTNLRITQRMNLYKLLKHMRKGTQQLTMFGNTNGIVADHGVQQ